MFQKRRLAALSLIVAIASPAVGAERSASHRPEVGRDLGRIGPWTISGGKSLGAAGYEVRVSRSRPGRRRSIVQVDREARLVGRSLPHPAREHVRNAERSRSIRSTSASPPTAGTSSRARTARCRSAGSRASHIAPGALDLQRRHRPEAAARRADRGTQARRVVPRDRAQRPDDVAREGAADVVSQPPSIGCTQQRRRRRGVPIHDDIVVFPRCGRRDGAGEARSSSARSAIRLPTARCRP